VEAAELHRVGESTGSLAHGASPGRPIRRTIER
jgi:hypothetical protein